MYTRASSYDNINLYVLCFGHIRDRLYFVISGIQLLFSFTEGPEGELDIFIGVDGGGHQPVNDVSFGDDGIYYDGAEDVIVFPEVHYHGSGLGDVSFHIYGGNGGIGLSDVKATVFQAFLQFVHYAPQLLTQFRLGLQQLEPFEVADGDWHRKAFGEDLAAGVIANVVDDGSVACHECADGGHGFGEGREIQVDVILDALFFTCAGACFSKGAEAVRIVYEETELVILFQGGDLFEPALVAGHAEDAFRDDEDPPGILLFYKGGGALQLFFAVFKIVVLEYVAMAGVKAEAVDDAGVAFGVVYDDVMAAAYGVDGAHNTLVAIVKQGGILFPFKGRQLSFQLLVIVAVTTHHTGSHGGGHTKLGGGFCVDLADLRVVGEAQVVIQAPDDLFFSPEIHPATDLSLQFGKCEISMRPFSVLADGAIVLH